MDAARHSADGLQVSARERDREVRTRAKEGGREGGREGGGRSERESEIVQCKPH